MVVDQSLLKRAARQAGSDKDLLGEGPADDRQEKAEDLETNEPEEEKDQFAVGSERTDPGKAEGPRVVIVASAVGANVAGRIDILAALAAAPVGEETVARPVVHRF